MAMAYQAAVRHVAKTLWARQVDCRAELLKAEAMEPAEPTIVSDPSCAVAACAAAIDTLAMVYGLRRSEVLEDVRTRYALLAEEVV